MKSSWVKGVIKVLLEYEMKKQYLGFKINFFNLNVRKKETLVDENFWKKIKEWKQKKQLLQVSS